MIFKSKGQVTDIIAKEEGLVKKYKRYLDNSTDMQTVNALNGLIDKHNSHIEVLERMLRG
ncbi:MAG: hypothetical protein ACRCW0_10410 [Clostridium sp.]